MDVCPQILSLRLLQAKKKAPRRCETITRILRWVTMITTLGFSVRAELAHHRQGQSPILMLVGLFFLQLPETRTL